MNWNELKQKIEAMPTKHRRRAVIFLDPYGYDKPIALDTLWTANERASKERKHCRKGCSYLAR